ncbi:MAG: NAD(P)-dependent oxidoreductase [Acidobacteriota bacterium]|jgi:nucleoside-diphosphate-sugar epimerase|nr:NAD(P)-dependent oxidoreductase [Acidobacteriota bacterium]
MKVLITGGSGFIGNEIIKECINSDFEVIHISRHRKYLYKENEIEKLSKVIAADITVYKDLYELEKIKNVDVIIHSAGLAHQFGDTSKEDFQMVNVQGTKNISKLASKMKVKQFILISTTAVYGMAKNMTDDNKNIDQDIFDENSLPRPQTFYAESKLEAERICSVICEKNKIPLTILRLAPVIGEENVGNVSRLVKAIDQKKFVWIGKGDNLKSLIYKNDVARACIKIIKGKTGDTEVFNLSAEPIRMKDFVNEIAAELKRKVPKYTISPNFFRMIFNINKKTLDSKKINKIEQTIEKWLSEDIYTSDKIKEKYNFVPKFSAAEGVRKQVGWYKLNKEQNL